MQYKSVRDVKWTGQRALVRVDFNVPQDAGGHITDDVRIKAALPTLQYLLRRNTPLVLMSHLGRPQYSNESRFTLQPIADRLAQLLKLEVHLVTDAGKSPSLPRKEFPGVLILENTRFLMGEVENDLKLAERLSKWGDIFVNDAFGSMHRSHASTVGIAEFLPAVAGLLVSEEIKYLSPLISSPEKPLVAILGGAKVSDKIGVFHTLLDLVDAFLLGGGMANTFLQAGGIDMAASLVEREALPKAREILRKGRGKIHLPTDFLVGAAPEAGTAHRNVGADEVPNGWLALDIGEASIAHYANRIAGAATVFWNGPMGLSEVPPFDKGTAKLAQCISEMKGATTIVGGGDSAAAIRKAGLEQSFSHVSTGGGATLEFVGGMELPGLQALDLR